MPEYPPPPSPVLSSTSLHGVGIELAAGAATAAGQAAWPAANRAILCPLAVPGPMLIDAIHVTNSSPSGAFDCGVYDALGQLLFSTGSLAQATGSPRRVAVSFFLPGPTVCYLALAADNSTGQFARQIPNVELLKAFGMAQVAAAFPLPKAVTLAGLASAYLPIIHLIPAGAKF